jgi:cyclase
MARGRAVKTTRFRDPTYVGDILNVVRIFNEKMVDEMAIVDIAAARDRTPPDLAFLETLSSECFMPLAYGGGVSTAQQVKDIISVGVEKVILNTAAFENSDVVREASRLVGRQSITVSLDVKRNWLGKPVPHTRGATRKSSLSLSDALSLIEEAGAGEILLNAVDREGTLSGFDLPLIREVTARTRLPVVAMGGASGPRNLVEAVAGAGAAAVAAGALFIFRGPHRAVLPSYPSAREINDAFNQWRDSSAGR